MVFWKYPDVSIKSFNPLALTKVFSVKWNILIGEKLSCVVTSTLRTMVTRSISFFEGFSFQPLIGKPWKTYTVSCWQFLLPCNWRASFLNKQNLELLSCLVFFRIYSNLYCGFMKLGQVIQYVDNTWVFFIRVNPKTVTFVFCNFSPTVCFFSCSTKQGSTVSVFCKFSFSEKKTFCLHSGVDPSMTVLFRLHDSNHTFHLDWFSD